MSSCEQSQVFRMQLVTLDLVQNTEESLKIFFKENSLLVRVILGTLNYSISMGASETKNLNIEELKNWEEFAMNSSKWRSNLQTDLIFPTNLRLLV